MTWPCDVFDDALSDVTYVRRLEAGVSTTTDEIVEALKEAQQKKGNYRHWWLL